MKTPEILPRKLHRRVKPGLVINGTLRLGFSGTEERRSNGFLQGSLFLLFSDSSRMFFVIIDTGLLIWYQINWINFQHIVSVMRIKISISIWYKSNAFHDYRHFEMFSHSHHTSWYIMYSCSWSTSNSFDSNCTESSENIYFTLLTYFYIKN